MRIDGEWVLGDDGETRPMVRVNLLTGTGDWVPAAFQIDTGADRTVLAAEALLRLGREPQPAPRQLGGVGGEVETVTVYTQLQFTRADGGTALIGSDFSGFLDPVALDVSVLGLDVLKNFSVILDYAGRVVCFLHGRHRYSIQES